MIEDQSVGSLFHSAFEERKSDNGLHKEAESSSGSDDYVAWSLLDAVKNQA